MITKEQKITYSIVCDNCGQSSKYNYNTENQAELDIVNTNIITFQGDHYCEECWTWNKETSSYDIKGFEVEIN